MGKGLGATVLTGLAIATIIARKAVSATEVGKKLGLSLADTAQAFRKEGLVLIGTAPGTWLAVDSAPVVDWLDALASSLHGLASVSDQSSAYIVYRVTGLGAREALQKGAFLDLGAEAFGIGASAVTAIGHIGAILACVEVESFEVAVFRSFSESFEHWLSEAGAQVAYGSDPLPELARPHPYLSN